MIGPGAGSGGRDRPIERRGPPPPPLPPGLIALLAGCSSGPGPGPEHHVPVATVAVSPRSLVVRVGQTAQLTAVPLDAHGTPLAGRTLTWTSSDSSVATVTAGRVAGLAPGPATITATSEGRSGATAVTVAAPGAATPAPPPL